MLETLAKVGGATGLIFGILYLLYREILRRKIFSKLSSAQTFVTFLFIALLVWSVAIAALFNHSPLSDHLPKIGQSSAKQSPKVLPMGGPWAPPSPRKYWEVDKSLVYLEASGTGRAFYFVEPRQELRSQGAEPSNLLFDGLRKDTYEGGLRKESTYEGFAYIYAGKCGRFSYPVAGPVLNDTTVQLNGEAPRIEQDTCVRALAHDGTPIVDRVSFVFRYKYEK